VVPLLNRIGSGSQTWVAVAVTRPALSALALPVFALFAGDYLPGLLAELAPPLDNGLGLMLMPAVAASTARPTAPTVAASSPPSAALQIRGASRERAAVTRAPCRPRRTTASAGHQPRRTSTDRKDNRR
jgi:hypothetical protein